jgi:hypothetical protein
MSSEDPTLVGAALAATAQLATSLSGCTLLMAGDAVAYAVVGAGPLGPAPISPPFAPIAHISPY